MNYATIAVHIGRALQVGLGLVAVALSAGAVNMGMLQSIAILLFALVMLAVAGLLELVVVRPLTRRAGGAT